MSNPSHRHRSLIESCRFQAARGDKVIRSTISTDMITKVSRQRISLLTRTRSEARLQAMMAANGGCHILLPLGQIPIMQMNEIAPTSSSPPTSATTSTPLHHSISRSLHYHTSPCEPTICGKAIRMVGLTIQPNGTRASRKDQHHGQLGLQTTKTTKASTIGSCHRISTLRERGVPFTLRSRSSEWIPSRPNQPSLLNRNLNLLPSIPIRRLSNPGSPTILFTRYNLYIRLRSATPSCLRATVHLRAQHQHRSRIRYHGHRFRSLGPVRGLGTH